MKIRKFIVLFILAFFVGYFIFSKTSTYFETKDIPAPWIMVTLLLFPFSYCVQALFKISEADENKTLSKSELRRLQPIINTKKSRLMILLAYYMLSAIILSLVFYIAPKNPALENYPLPIAGGLLLSSLFSFVFIKSIMDEIQTFKSKLMHREEEDRKRKELLDLLNKKAEK